MSDFIWFAQGSLPRGWVFAVWRLRVRWLYRDQSPLYSERVHWFEIGRLGFRWIPE